MGPHRGRSKNKISTNTKNQQNASETSDYQLSFKSAKNPLKSSVYQSSNFGSVCNNSQVSTSTDLHNLQSVFGSRLSSMLTNIYVEDIPNRHQLDWLIYSGILLAQLSFGPLQGLSKKFGEVPERKSINNEFSKKNLESSVNLQHQQENTTTRCEENILFPQDILALTKCDYLVDNSSA